MLPDATYMDRALLLAGRARGRTSPNPLVGCVVVAPDGTVVGTGYHERAGEPHAEVFALRQAGHAARGATLYCTLEPCSHFGRTPPCVGRILESGVARVVASVSDPNPRIAGEGFRQLREAGLQVEIGLRADEATRMNRPFFSMMQRGRPWVQLKAATSLDGRVAAAPGQPTRLTSPDADRDSQILRAEVDAIAVGSETILTDDPRLTARDVFRERPLVRAVFDRRLRTPPTARLFAAQDAGPVVVLTSTAAIESQPDRVRALETSGAAVVGVDGGELPDLLRALGARGVQWLLVEGGPTLHRAFFQAGLADAVRLIVAPRMLGAGGVPWLGIPDVPTADLHPTAVRPCGPDVIIDADVHRNR
jgi:diaminohydroxyphosphoribosylaminopyrimidine deaminase / 5-amino-6-(5-phosphoribosylamino)uracil reductase